MPKVLFQNLTDRPTSLGIEPWADAETLEPEKIAEIEYDEPAQVVFALMDDGRATVSVDSDRVLVTANGRTRKING